MTNPEENTPVESLDPRGETITLDNGDLIITPNPEVVKKLQEADERIQYFPTNLEDANNRRSPSDAYYRGVVDHIAEHVTQDFNAEEVLVRGTTASLVKPFDHWFASKHEANSSGPVHTVLEILKAGTDTGNESTMLGGIVTGKEGSTLNVETTEWLAEHLNSVALEASLETDQHGTEDRTALAHMFPVLLVYGKETTGNPVANGRTYSPAGDPEKWIEAIYITDKIIDPRAHLAKSMGSIATQDDLKGHIDR